jgi:ribonuclease HI
MASPVPSLTLFTDASLLGWGAYLERQTVSGMWSSTIQKDHINLLEMRAVLLALSHFKLCLESLSIVLATDNTTVVAYLKNQGGTHCYALYQLAKDVLILCSQFQIRLVVRHIPGHLNVLADSLSRSLVPVNTEWELHQAKTRYQIKGQSLFIYQHCPKTDSVSLCPVRILSIYLTRTASLRSSTNKRLVIPIKKGDSDLSIKTISTWICKIISLAYESSGQVILDKFLVKAHDVRALARI